MLKTFTRAEWEALTPQEVHDSFENYTVHVQGDPAQPVSKYDLETMEKVGNVDHLLEIQGMSQSYQAQIICLICFVLDYSIETDEVNNFVPVEKKPTLRRMLEKPSNESVWNCLSISAPEGDLGEFPRQEYVPCQLFHSPFSSQ